jgi:hypothetical protein
VAPADRPAFEAALGLAAIHDAQAGLLADADTLNAALYEGIED